VSHSAPRAIVASIRRDPVPPADPSAAAADPSSDWPDPSTAELNRRMHPFARPFCLPFLPSWTLPDSWHFPNSDFQTAFHQPWLPVEYVQLLTKPDNYFNDDSGGGYWDSDDPIYAQLRDYSFVFPEAEHFRHLRLLLRPLEISLFHLFFFLELRQTFDYSMPLYRFTSIISFCSELLFMLYTCSSAFITC
jgi:hypothetical protein